MVGSASGEGRIGRSSWLSSKLKSAPKQNRVNKLEENWFYGNSNRCQESKQINEARVHPFSKKTDRKQSKSCMLTLNEVVMVKYMVSYCSV
jgi:hypothetical protein